MQRSRPSPTKSEPAIRVLALTGRWSWPCSTSCAPARSAIHVADAAAQSSRAENNEFSCAIVFSRRRGDRFADSVPPDPQDDSRENDLQLAHVPVVHAAESDAAKSARPDPAAAPSLRVALPALPWVRAAISGTPERGSHAPGAG